MAASYHLDAWGQYRFPTELNASANRFGFTGYIFDRETDLHYANARYYDSEFGRFTTQDSYLGNVDNPPSLHRYFYANASPTRYVDPTGHAAQESELAALAKRNNEERSGNSRHSAGMAGQAGQVALDTTPVAERDENAKGDGVMYRSELGDTGISGVAPNPSVPEGEVKEEGWFGQMWAAAVEKKEELKRRVGEKTGAFGASLIDSEARDTQVEILFPKEHEAAVRRQAAASNNASQIAVGSDEVAEEIARTTGEVGTEVAVQIALEKGSGAVLGAAAGAVGKGRRALARVGARSLDDLSQAAAASQRNGFTRAGNALAKHENRAMTAFPKAAGDAAAKNTAGQFIVDDILTNPASTFTNRQTGRFGEVLDVVAPDGRGVRFGSDGTFIGFLEPPR